jgi:hypothetical protein
MNLFTETGMLFDNPIERSCMTTKTQRSFQTQGADLNTSPISLRNLGDVDAHKNMTARSGKPVSRIIVIHGSPGNESAR